MNTRKQTLLMQAQMNVKAAAHPAAAKRISDRARQTLVSRAARQGSAAGGRLAAEMLPQDLGGAFHRMQRPSFEVPDVDPIQPSFAELV